MIVLCGPRPALPAVLGELGVKGSVALVTAGWQEREDDPAMIAALGVPVVPLGLHVRTEDVFARDPELAAAYKVRQIKLKSMQDIYRVRLDHTVQAARVIEVRRATPELVAEEDAASLSVLRHIDRDHIERCRAVNAEFVNTLKPSERPAITRHTAQLRTAIASTDALVIAGGHVAVLVNRLRLFDILPITGTTPIVAWSAGAMALTDRIVLFHDDRPHGNAISELLEAGLGAVPGLVALPDARLRLRLDDGERVAQLALRYAPAACVALDSGAQLWVDSGRVVRAVHAHRLVTAGTVAELRP